MYFIYRFPNLKEKNELNLKNDFIPEFKLEGTNERKNRNKCRFYIQIKKEEKYWKN